MNLDYFEGTSSGRLDVMGGIADYSGSLVIQKPIKEKTTVKFRHRTDGLIIAKTFSKEEEISVFIIEYQELINDGKPDFEYAGKILKKKIGGDWASYVVGCLIILHIEKSIKIKGGEFEIRSDIPEGKGVSSSAALEIATMKALSKAYNVQFMGTEIARFAQIVENKIVGAPCGLMDQLSCAFGKEGTLLPIICQPDKLLSPIKLPNHVHFIGIDSGTRHHVSGASYTDVRTAAFMGYSILAQHLGVSVDQLNTASRQILKKNLPFEGYLTNICKNEWNETFVKLIPDELTGHEFISKYCATTDLETEIIQRKNYLIKACTQHPILENDRINSFYTILKLVNGNKISNEYYEKLGEKMYESHESYSTVHLGSKPTDRLVEMVKEHKGKGVFGAKITGGGSGGTVCILAVGEQGLNTVKKIHIDFQNEINKKVKLFL